MASTVTNCTTENGHAPYTEPYRPQFHFSPSTGWLNDPNGLVYYDGEYHLFYQHVPVEPAVQVPHWGHAVSTDLVHWQHLPIALYPDAIGAIWSGSAVVDWENTSGFQTGDEKVLVAFFTHRDDANLQQQSIAYSNDRGRSWLKYDGNPMIPNPDIADFRDPKVFWHAPSSHWVMAVVAGKRVLFYTSPDLKTWTFASEFGARQGSQRGVWECPDLFELPVDGDPQNKKWVLIISVAHQESPEEPATQVFVGHFDGTTFTNDAPPEEIRWLDWGSDNYAGVTFSDIPSQDGRRILIGWMSHWWHARDTPTSPWCGAMTVPRELTLRTDADGSPRLASSPVAELRAIRRRHLAIDEQVVSESTSLTVAGDIRGGAFEAVLEFDLGSASEFGVSLTNRAGDQTIVGYDVENETLFVDRRASGEVDFHALFGAHTQEAPLPLDSELELHILVDWSSIEVFANDGNAVITDLIYPRGEINTLGLYAKGGSVNLIKSDIWELASTWKV
jgi:fructan beta-fructosidase